MGNGQDWWREALIYQVYPRSFCDANGDGIGDLPGITEKLPYIASLGVDALWISPFFRSPMKDFGYDIADYRQVDPIFGRNEDFGILLARAHELGLKLLIDLVCSHTSDQHPWFMQSRSGRDNPRADWYIWADAKPDGAPPNNWLSIFGGSAWQWEPRRGQYYLHNFLTEQPDLNLNKPQVRQAILQEARYWLELGVDGFRLDAINFGCCDPALRDNPPLAPDQARFDLAPPANPYVLQQHIHDRNQPQLLEFLREMRALLDAYGAVGMGEVAEDHGESLVGLYTAGAALLHTGYTPNAVGIDLCKADMERIIRRWQAQIGQGHLCWSFGNHDWQRLASRWPVPHAAPLSLALLLILPGAACWYQGDELALPEADIPYEALQDPYGRTFWPEYKGRDGCRTPMPWRENPAGSHGFSLTESAKSPWLPLLPAQAALNVQMQEAQPESSLRRCRQLIAWRKNQPALTHMANFTLLQNLPDPVLGLRRQAKGQGLVALFNLGAAPVRLDTLPLAGIAPISSDYGFHHETGEIAPYAVFLAEEVEM